MKVVYKYELNLGLTIVDIPQNCKIVDFEFQRGKPYIWAEVETENTTGKICLNIYGTGHEIIKTAVYIKTVHNNGFVWHLYDLT